jgi:hypothetical protein
MVHTRYIPGKCMGYAIHILVIIIFKCCQLSKKECMLEELEMHVHSMAFKDTNTIVSKWHVLLKTGYTRDTPGI